MFGTLKNSVQGFCGKFIEWSYTNFSMFKLSWFIFQPKTNFNNTYSMIVFVQYLKILFWRRLVKFSKNPCSSFIMILTNKPTGLMVTCYTL